MTMRARLAIAGIVICGLAAAAGTARAVLGGQPDTTHPYVTMLADGQTVCSGALLSPTVILTAAHCFSGDGQGAPVRAYFGQQPAPGCVSHCYTGSYYFDPQFGGLGNGIPNADTHDVAVVVFGSPIPTSESAGLSGALPPQGLVDSFTNNTPIDLVGYGVVGFARGGGQPQQVALYQRFTGETTAFKSNGAIGDEFLKLHSGVCFGDSGGPDLLGGTNIVVAENSFVNNNVCAGNTYSYRVDTPQALSWITSAVAAAGGSLAH